MVLNLDADPGHRHRPVIRPHMLPPTRSLRSAALTWFSGFAIVLLFAGMTIYLHHRGDRELRAMPASQRRMLYERTLEILRTACTSLDESPGSALAEHCREQAVFIKRFPECDRACREISDPLTPRATR